MAYYEYSDESDDQWDIYGSWDDDDFNDDYWYNGGDDYYTYDDDEDYDESEEEEDDDPWDNILSSQEESNIIMETVKSYKMNVNKYSPKELKYFTVRGEGLFECEGCDNRWTSHNATIKIDIFKKLVSKKFKQRCKFCPNYWATPGFTDDRFDEIMETVASKYKSRMKGDNHIQLSPPAVGNGKPHMEKHCERCQELGQPCWKYGVNAV